MKPRSLAATAALALLLGALVPATAANAAEPSVSGIVSDASGPVAFAVVGYFAPISGELATVTTDEAGQYSFDVPTNAGPYYVIGNLNSFDDDDAVSLYADDSTYNGIFYGTGGKRDYLYQTLTPFASGSNSSVNVVLDKPGSIAVSSSALKNQGVEVISLDGSSLDYETASSSGSYEFTNLIPGRYKVRAPFFDTKYSEYTSPTLTVQAGKKTTLAATPVVGAVIKGVVKAGSKAAAKVNVYAYSSAGNGDDAATVTDKKGAYSFAGLNVGTYTLSFSSTSGSSGSNVVGKIVKVKTKAGKTTTSNVSLTAAGEVAGSIKVTKGAEWAQAFAVKSGKFVNADYITTKSKAKFSVKGLSAGSYTLYVTDSKQKYYAAKKFTVKAGKKTKVGTVGLKKKTITLSGKVTPAGNGYISASSNAAYGSGSEIKKGKFSIKGLIPGTFTVFTYLDGREQATATKVKVTKSTKKNFKAGKLSGKLTGTVTLAGVPVDGDAYSSSKAGSGYFSIDNGTLSGTGTPGKNTVDNVSIDSLFVSGAPFWADFPDNKKTFTLTSGKTTSLGSFELKLNR